MATISGGSGTASISISGGSSYATYSVFTLPATEDTYRVRISFVTSADVGGEGPSASFGSQEFVAGGGDTISLAVKEESSTATLAVAYSYAGASL
jgi:hypothetical protein